MFLEILKQNDDGTLATNESGWPIVTSLVNLNHVSRIYIGNYELPYTFSNHYQVIAFIPGSIEPHRNAATDATNKKILFFGSQENCEEYLRTLNQDLIRNNLRLPSPAGRILTSPDETDK